MTTHPTPVDISHMPDLLKLAEEVEMTRKPRKLIKDRETVAILIPIRTSLSPKKKRTNIKVDYEAFHAAFGSWNDVDTDALLKNINANRRRTNTRPSVEL